MEPFTPVVIAASVIGITPKIYNCFERAKDSWKTKNSKTLMISKDDCPEVFYGIIIFMSKYCKKYNHSHLVSIPKEFRNDKTKKIYPVPPANTIIEIECDKIKINMLTISDKMHTINAYRVDVKKGNEKQMHKCISDIIKHDKKNKMCIACKDAPITHEYLCALDENPELCIFCHKIKELHDGLDMKAVYEYLEY